MKTVCGVIERPSLDNKLTLSILLDMINDLIQDLLEMNDMSFQCHAFCPPISSLLSLLASHLAFPPSSPSMLCISIHSALQFICHCFQTFCLLLTNDKTNNHITLLFHITQFVADNEISIKTVGHSKIWTHNLLNSCNQCQLTDKD